MPLKRTREGRGKADGKVSRMPPALKWPQRRATIGRAALCVRAALGVWLGGGRAAAPAASLGGLVRAFARPPAFLALARCALCSLAVCAFAQGAPARRACVLPPVAAVVRGLRVGRARAVAFCPAFFLRWWRGGGLAFASCFRPACAVAVRLAAVSPSAGVVRAVLRRGAGWGGFRARWPSLRRRPGRLGRWPRSVLRPLGGLSSGFPSCFAPAARLRALSLAAVPAFGWRWGGALRSVSRRVVPLPPPRPRGAPPFPSSCFPLRGAHPGGNFSGGRGTTSRVLWPLAKVGCARGARPAVAAVSAVVLPPLACALRLPRRVLLPRPSARVAPVVWLAGRGGEGCFVLQRPRMGDGHAPLALRSPPLAAIQPKPRGKAKGGRFHPRLYTKFCVQKIPGQKNTGRGRRGTAPARKTGAKHKNPLKCHQKAPALTRDGQRGIPKRPADRPKMGCQMSSRCLSVR